MKRNQDLTKGRVSSRLLAFYFPMLLTNTLQQAYSFFDILIIGKGLGDRAVAAVGNLSSPMLLITGFLLGMTNGFSVVIAQSCGAADRARLRKSIARSIMLCAVIAACLTASALILLYPVLIFMKTPLSLMRDSLIYGCIILGGLSVNAAYNLGACILRSIGDSKTPFTAILISSVINIALDFVLVFVFKTGAEGAAAATVLSQAIATFLCWQKLRKQPLIIPDRESFAKDRAIDQCLIKNGLPSAFMHSVTSIGCMIVQSYINQCGAVYTSAYAACSKYINLFMLPSLTVGFALQAFVSQNIGARCFRRVKEGVKFGFIMALCFWFVIGGVSLRHSDYLAGLLLHDPAAVSLTSAYLRICGSMLLLLNLLFVFRSSVQGMGHPLVPMCSGVLEMLIRIPVIAILIPGLGFHAAAYAECAAWFGALLLNAAAYVFFIRKAETLIRSEGIKNNQEE